MHLLPEAVYKHCESCVDNFRLDGIRAPRWFAACGCFLLFTHTCSSGGFANNYSTGVLLLDIRIAILTYTWIIAFDLSIVTGALGIYMDINLGSNTSYLVQQCLKFSVYGEGPFCYQ